MHGINLSLAAFPGMGFVEAMLRAREGVSEPLLGSLSLEQVQLCPQNRGTLTEDVAEGLKAAYPETQFRLHANVRVLSRRLVMDLDRFCSNDPYWVALARISQILGAPAYTAHAGLRTHATLDQVFDNTRRASDLMGCAVGIEGHYPTPRGIYLLDTWEDYITMLEADIPYALDLSHVNILAVQSGRMERQLVEELMASPNCIELHVSGNNGERDSHEVLDAAPWWWYLMGKLHPDCVIFSEGTQRH